MEEEEEEEEEEEVVPITVLSRCSEMDMNLTVLHRPCRMAGRVLQWVVVPRVSIRQLSGASGDKYQRKAQPFLVSLRCHHHSSKGAEAMRLFLLVKEATPPTFHRAKG